MFIEDGYNTEACLNIFQNEMQVMHCSEYEYVYSTCNTIKYDIVKKVKQYYRVF